VEYYIKSLLVTRDIRKESSVMAAKDIERLEIGSTGYRREVVVSAGMELKSGDKTNAFYDAPKLFLTKFTSKTTMMSTFFCKKRSCRSMKLFSTDAA
jgi:hypothetical protein